MSKSNFQVKANGNDNGPKGRFDRKDPYYSAKYFATKYKSGLTTRRRRLPLR